MIAPPINPPAIPAATPRWACAGAGAARAETAKVAAAATAIIVLFMASPFSRVFESTEPTTADSDLSHRNFHNSLERSMNAVSQADQIAQRSRVCEPAALHHSTRCYPGDFCQHPRRRVLDIPAAGVSRVFMTAAGINRGIFQFGIG